MPRNLLFVTTQDGSGDDGLPYVLNLARITQKGISVLLLCKSGLSERFGDWMTAVTFAEANEHETAREAVKRSARDGVPGKKMVDIRERCTESGIAASIYTSSDDISSALKNLLRRDRSIDLVLLSPNITFNGRLRTRDLKKLLRAVSMPIVTLTRNGKSHPNASNKYLEVA